MYVLMEYACSYRTRTTSTSKSKSKLTIIYYLLLLLLISRSRRLRLRILQAASQLLSAIGRGNSRILVLVLFFFGLFSKDASVVIGLFSPRTQVFRCNNVSYR